MSKASILPLILLFTLFFVFFGFSQHYMKLSFEYINASNPKVLENFFQMSLNSCLAMLYAVLFLVLAFLVLILIVYYVLGLASKV
jgi:flagellar biosynthesis protein FliR